MGVPPESPVVTVQSDRPMRSDARRNRELVLAAAESVFSEMGLSAPIEEVGRRAGVGVGTVCRHFPSKQVLVEAVLKAMYTSLLDDAVAALERPDPGPAFRDFYFSLSDFQARHRVLAEQMATAIDMQIAAPELKASLHEAMTQLVERAQAVGEVRPDIGPADVAMLFSGLAAATAVAGDLQPTLRERCVTIILDGLRPEVASVLPGKPLEHATVRRRAASAGQPRGHRCRTPSTTSAATVPGIMQV